METTLLPTLVWRKRGISFHIEHFYNLELQVFKSFLVLLIPRLTPSQKPLGTS
jgi:hypothetical protein